MLILKGIITLNIEVDYGTMLEGKNQGALYLFTGAKTVEEMVKIHMDSIGEEMVAILDKKPLVTYSIDGKLRQEAQKLEEPAVEALPVEEITGVEEDRQPTSAQSFEMLNKLDEAIDHVSLELGIPQKIKVNGDLMAQLEAYSKDDVLDGVITEYKGFPIEQEGMEEAFIVVYKTYSGSEVKFFS